MRVFVDSFVDDADVVSSCGKYRWDFSAMFGPLFVRKNGEPLKKQPLPGSPAWSAFQTWYDEKKAKIRRGVPQ